MRESRTAGSVVSGPAAYHRCTSFVAPPGALSPCEGPLAAVQTVLYLVVFLFLIALIVRIAVDWIQFFSRDWRPRGPVLVFAEGAYSATDPAVRTLRRLIPPLRLGAVQFDLAILILFLLTGFLLQVLAP